MKKLTITVDGKTYFSLPRVRTILSIRQPGLDKLISEGVLTPVQFRTNGGLYISQSELAEHLKTKNRAATK